MAKNNSKKVVILGQSPLPIEHFKKNYASGARTWNFAKSAQDADCEVLLIGIRIPHIYDEKEPSIIQKKIGDIEYYSIDNSVASDKKWIKEKIMKFNPDSIVGVTTFPASILADLEIELPFWADLYGSVMAEAQAKAFVFDDNSYLYHFFNMESKVLSKADIFSTVSEAQGFSLIGELAVWGRLNKESLGYRFIRVIPAMGDKEQFTHTKNVIRGIFADNSNFVILYSGGYNTWTDIETLFFGLEIAMKNNPKIIFVSTGGKIEGHDEYTYEKFENLINSSDVKDRFHLCGWVPHEDLPNYYFESDLGINSDKYTYEALLGSRTRVLDWMKASLPFISTPLSEITIYLIKKGMAYSFQSGKPEDLAEKLLHIASNREELAKKRNYLKKIFFEEFTYDKSFKEFKNWIQSPNISPDRNTKINLIKVKPLKELVDEKIISKEQALATMLWPSLSKSLKLLRLGKYENGLKKRGESMLSTFAKNYAAEISEIKSFEIKVNEKIKIPISVKNLGKEWLPPSMSENGINISYAWKNPNGEIFQRDGIRTPITRIIKNGGKVEVDTTVQAPSKPGKYILEFDLVKEGEFWFSEAFKSKTRQVQVQVKF